MYYECYQCIIVNVHVNAHMYQHMLIDEEGCGLKMLHNRLILVHQCKVIEISSRILLSNQTGVN